MIIDLFPSRIRPELLLLKQLDNKAVDLDPRDNYYESEHLRAYWQELDPNYTVGCLQEKKDGYTRTVVCEFSNESTPSLRLQRRRVETQGTLIGIELDSDEFGRVVNSQHFTILTGKTEKPSPGFWASLVGAPDPNFQLKSVSEFKADLCLKFAKDLFENRNTRLLPGQFPRAFYTVP